MHLQAELEIERGYQQLSIESTAFAVHISPLRPRWRWKKFGPNRANECWRKITIMIPFLEVDVAWKKRGDR